MTHDIGGDTFSARLSALPVTEHAILLNRFKFLDLVQRVAAADVAEMVQTVGLEALLYKDTLEKIPPLHMHEEVGKRSRRTTTTKVTGQKKVGRHAASRGRVGNAVLADARGDAPPRSRRRFSSQKEEQEFIKRMSRPQKAWDPLDYMIRKSPRGFSEGDAAHKQRKLMAVAHRVISNTIVPTISSLSRFSEVAADDHYNSINNADNDTVVIESSPEQPQLVSLPLKAQATDQAHNRGMYNFEQKPREKEESLKERKSLSPQEDVKQTVFTVEEVNSLPNVTGTNTQINNNGAAVQATQNAQGSGLRSRGSFAPKAKPKAAAEVSRVPLEVIRHASALLAGKKGVSSPPPPAPQSSSSVHPAILSNVSANDQSSSVQLQMSHSLHPTSAGQSSKQIELEVQRDNTPPCTVTPLTLSDSALAELASSVERMLQDHQLILDGIMRDGIRSSIEPLKTSTANKEENAEVDAEDDLDRDHKDKFTSGNITKRILSSSGTGVESFHTRPQAYDIFEDISDEEDELLLVSRIQRKLGSIDREMTAIEEREGELLEYDDELNNNKGNEKGGLSHTASSQKGRGRRKVTLDMRETNSKNSFATYGRQSGRRRGEIPRAIVDRICSFQKENHEYIRYTEKQWNTSHITENVFAQRLTESLLDDAFQEVLEEVAGILDTYVEGLALHELQ